MKRRFLEDCLAAGLSLESIGELAGRHPSTVGYWLKKYGVKAVGSERFSPRGGLDRGPLEAALKEGMTLAEMAKMVNRDISTVRYWLGRYLVEEAGGRCQICGYDRYSGALQFHHLDPAAKSFSLSRRGCTRAFAELQAEAAKCALLCANCHAEVENGVAKVDRGCRA